MKTLALLVKLGMSTQFSAISMYLKRTLGDTQHTEHSLFVYHAFHNIRFIISEYNPCFFPSALDEWLLLVR